MLERSGYVSFVKLSFATMTQSLWEVIFTLNLVAANAGTGGTTDMIWDIIILVVFVWGLYLNYWRL